VISQDDSGVTVTVVDRATGTESSIRAAWVIAAHCNDSSVRASLGIGRTGKGDMGHLINAFFRAPLGPLIAERPAWSYAILTPELTGAFVTFDGANEWILHRNLAAGARRGLPGRTPRAARRIGSLPSGRRCLCSTSYATSVQGWPAKIRPSVLPP
jgi:2-polyprenyl-6-methoxyphenol hydroxylase-like FAD-dependent oxidoreductase